MIGWNHFEYYLLLLMKLWYILTENWCFSHAIFFAHFRPLHIKNICWHFIVLQVLVKVNKYFPFKNLRERSPVLVVWLVKVNYSITKYRNFVVLSIFVHTYFDFDFCCPICFRLHSIFSISFQFLSDFFQLNWIILINR